MEYRPVLEKTLGHALEYFEKLDSMPVGATASVEELRERLVLPLNDKGIDGERVIDELVAGVEGGLLASTSGRFFGWVIGGSVPAAVAADWMTSVWDQNCGLYSCAPAESILEEACGVWLKDLLGLPAQASFSLATGCQMAHNTCLASARNKLLGERDWDVERDGLFGAPRLKVITSVERHGTILRSVRLLGLGTNSIVALPSDGEGRLTADTLEAALKERNGAPTIVVLQAGDLNVGAFDPYKDLIPVAHAYGAWVHVDGAFGLWANASEQYRHLLEGVEQADSWATDGHKWLNVPYDCGYAFVKHPQAHHAAMSHLDNYLTHDDEARDAMDWTPDFSRRGRGVATYAAIRQMGRRGVSDMIERCCGHAKSLVERIGALEQAEQLCDPLINQGLVRFLAPGESATEQDHDQYTDAVIEAIEATGEALFSGTTWRGMRCMRVSVTNWQTSQADVDRAVRAVESVLNADIEA